MAANHARCLTSWRWAFVVAVTCSIAAAAGAVDAPASTYVEGVDAPGLDNGAGDAGTELSAASVTAAALRAGSDRAWRQLATTVLGVSTASFDAAGAAHGKRTPPTTPLAAFASALASMPASFSTGGEASVSKAAELLQAHLLPGVAASAPGAGFLSHLLTTLHTPLPPASDDATPPPPPPPPPHVVPSKGTSVLGLLPELLGPQSAAGSGDGWKDLLVLDCAGTLRMSGAVGTTVVNGAIGSQLLQWLATQIRSRAECACSSLSDDELLRRFVPSLNMLAAVFNGVTGAPASDTGVQDTCVKQFWRGFFTDNLLGAMLARQPWRLELPTTCSYETVAAGKPCTFAIHEQVTDTQLMIALAQCPNGQAQPFVSVSCSGWYCQNLYKPCSSASDCGTMKECQEVMSIGDIASGLVNASMADTTEQLSSCPLQSWAQAGMQVFGSYYDSPPDPAPSSVRLCMPSERTLNKIAEGLRPSKRRSSVNQEAAACVAAGCRDVMVVGEGVCDEACDNAACFFDGGDCLVEPTLRCPSQSTHFECSGHGHCSSRGSGSDDDEQDDDDGTDPSTDDNGGGTRVFKCECDAGWQGTDCSMRVDACWSTASHPADRATAADGGASSTTPALPCSGYGYCSSGGCQCFPGHTGTTCEVASATCPVGANGQVCSGQGVCRGQDAGAAYCACFTVFSSGAAGACEEGEVDPEWSSCPGYVSTYGVPCNGHGTPIINPTTGQCTCQCEQYYQDDACTPVPGTENRCLASFPFGPSGDDDDDADDDDGYRLSCGGAGVCMEAVAGFPQRCMCDRNLAPPACGNPLSQPGASKQERWCAWAEGGCNYTATTVSSRAITSWDGQLPQGAGSATSADRMSGFAFAPPPPLSVAGQNGVDTVAYRACDGSVGFNFGPANLGIALRMGTANEWALHIAKQMWSLQQCRAKGMGVTALTQQQFNVRFAPHSPLMTLYPFSAGPGSANSTDFRYGFRGADLAPVSPYDTATFASLPKLLMPASCTFASVSASPSSTCKWQYSELSTLLGAPLTLSYESQSCPNDPHGVGLPSVGVTANGAMYNALRTLQPCPAGQAQCGDAGSGVVCEDLSQAGYLNLGRFTGTRRDPLGVPLFGIGDFNTQCSTEATWRASVRTWLLELAGRPVPAQPSSSLDFCVFGGGLSTTKLLLWLVTAFDVSCLSSHPHDCNSNPIVAHGLTATTSDAAPPADLNDDVVYHGSATAPPGFSWIECTVLLPGLSSSDVTLGLAGLFKDAVAADLRGSVSPATLGSFSAADVLITEVHGDARRRLAASPTAADGSSSVALTVNLQVSAAAAGDMEHAVEGSGSTGGSHSFTGSLGTALASYGVISNAAAGHVAVSPGSHVPGSGLSPGVIAGIVCGCIGGVALAVVLAVVVVRRRRRMAVLRHEASASTLPTSADPFTSAASTAPLLGPTASRARASDQQAQTTRGQPVPYSHTSAPVQPSYAQAQPRAPHAAGSGHQPSYGALAAGTAASTRAASSQQPVRVMGAMSVASGDGSVEGGRPRLVQTHYDSD